MASEFDQQRHSARKFKDVTMRTGAGTRVNSSGITLYE